MGFGTSSGDAGTQVNPAQSFRLFGNFANILSPGSVRQFEPRPGEPFGSLKPRAGFDPFGDLLSTIDEQFAARPDSQFLPGVTAPFAAADANLAGVQDRARGLSGRVSDDLTSGVLGRADQASIAGVEASRRAGGLVGDNARVAATSAAQAAALQNAAIGQTRAQAEIAGTQAEGNIAGQRAQLATAESSANQFGVGLEESRFSQELLTRVGARENFLNIIASLAGAGTSGVGGATTGGGSSGFNFQLPSGGSGGGAK